MSGARNEHIHLKVKYAHLVPERLVSAEQHRLELVRAIQLASDYQVRAFDQFDLELSYRSKRPSY